MTNEKVSRDAGLRVVGWYRDHQRDLPWRRTKDPYAILVSEVMLQQTQVETVIPYYLRFMERFPDISALAAAAEEEVLLFWQGLGYYRRARMLHKAAGYMMAHCAGTFPGNYEHVIELPGVGAYTAGAVCSIAFGLPVPAVDGNVLRVMSRLVCFDESVDSEAARRKITAMVQQMIPADAASDFTQGMMEIGAMVCAPQKPDCVKCPLKGVCRAEEDGLQKMFPVRTPRKKQVTECFAAFLDISDSGLLMEKRPAEGIAGGMWGVPMATAEPARDSGAAWLGHVRHVFTHRVWEIDVYMTRGPEGCAGEFCQRVRRHEIAGYPVPTVFAKVLALLPQHLDF